MFVKPNKLYQFLDIDVKYSIEISYVKNNKSCEISINVEADDFLGAIALRNKRTMMIWFQLGTHERRISRLRRYCQALALCSLFCRSYYICWIAFKQQKISVFLFAFFFRFWLFWCWLVSGRIVPCMTLYFLHSRKNMSISMPRYQ